MAYFQCIISKGTSIVITATETSTKLPGISFVTGDLPVTKFQRNGVMEQFSLEYTGNPVDGDTSGVIQPTTNTLATQSIINTFNPLKSSTEVVTDLDYTVNEFHDNYLFKYKGNSAGVIHLPDVSKVPDDFDIMVSNRSLYAYTIRAHGSDKIEETQPIKKLTRNSWCKLRVFDGGWVVSEENILSDGVAPGGFIEFSSNKDLVKEDNGNAYEYVGTPSSVLKLPSTDDLDAAWKVTVYNNSPLGSVLSIHTANAHQTIAGSQIFYVASGESVDVNYAGTGQVFTHTAATKTATQYDVAQGKQGDVLSLVPQSDGALGWGPITLDLAFMKKLSDDAAPKLSANLDLNGDTHGIINSASRTKSAGVGVETLLLYTAGGYYTAMFGGAPGKSIALNIGDTESNIECSEELQIKTASKKDLIFKPGGDVRSDANIIFTGTEVNNSGKGIFSNTAHGETAYIPVGCRYHSSYLASYRYNVLGTYLVNDPVNPSHFGSEAEPDNGAFYSQSATGHNMSAVRSDAHGTKKSILQVDADNGVYLSAAGGQIRFSNKGVTNTNLILDVSTFTLDATLSIPNFSGTNVSVAKGKDGNLKGDSSNRPTNPKVGMMYFDTALAAAGKPIWYTGSDWVDATGTVV